MTLPKSPSFRLDGRPVLVTGASSGIGEGCAVALGEMGAQVTIVARGQEKLDALTLEQVHSAAQKVFGSENYVCVIVQPDKNKSK